MNLFPFSHEISNDPMDRVPEAMKPILTDPERLFDIHCHVFNFKDVPSGFIGMRIPMNKRFLVWLEKMLHKMKGHTDKDKMSKIAYFLDYLNSCSSEEIADKLVDYYPDHKAILTPLLMDMGTSIKGKLKRSYNEQIEEITRLRNKNPEKLLPFICIDPANPDAKANFLKVFSKKKDYQFFGVKLYPSLGYLPSHPDLMEIFAICEEKNIPITAHCGGARVHNSKRWMRNIPGLKKGFSGKWRPSYTNKLFLTKNQYSNFFNDPRNWEPVLANYPKLKLNLAHFGGGKAWRRYIKRIPGNRVDHILDLMKRYKYVYTDISYTASNPEFCKEMKKLIKWHARVADRILFGSDFYMIELEGKYQEILANMRREFGEETMHRMAVENPAKFLLERTDIEEVKDSALIVSPR